MIGYTRAQLFRENVHKGSFPLVPNEADRSYRSLPIPLASH